MGGAFIGVADDASAGYWNPAGLTQNDRVFAGAQFRYQRQRVQNRLDADQDLVFLFDEFSRGNSWNISFASFNSPVMIKGQRFYLSASWQRLQDTQFKGNWELTDFSISDPDEPFFAESLLTQSRLVEGGVKAATLAAATQLKEEVLSAGFNVNIYLGKAYDSARTILDGSEFGVIYERRLTDNVNRQDYIGINFGFGALYQTDQYGFGISVKTPFQLKTENDFRFYNATYEITPDSLQLRDETGVLALTDTKVDMPLQVGVGIAYRPQENFLLAADYEYKAFGSSKEYFQEDLFDPKSEFAEFDPNWKDVHQFRAGMEYLVTSSWGTIPLRAGFRVEPQPYRHLINGVGTALGGSAYSLGDQVIGEVYTAGTGIQWKLVRLDLTYEFHSTKTYSDGYFIEYDTRPQYIYLQDNRRHRVSLGFTGYF
jgi:opacity protein-like surface antigen